MNRLLILFGLIILLIAQVQAQDEPIVVQGETFRNAIKQTDNQDALERKRMNHYLNEQRKLKLSIDKALNELEASFSLRYKGQKEYAKQLKKWYLDQSHLNRKKLLSDADFKQAYDKYNNAILELNATKNSFWLYKANIMLQFDIMAPPTVELMEKYDKQGTYQIQWLNEFIHWYNNSIPPFDLDKWTRLCAGLQTQKHSCTDVWLTDKQLLLN
ncbi:hypothetical protein [Marinicella sp. W31]|uniref:hypothetical protein n=1 Tax=Marinicella sp. W31 TaxID=3023713 RepID=UPI003757ED63